MQKNTNYQANCKVNNLALTGLFVAIAYIAVALFEIPLLPGADFLKYDAKDVFFVLAACFLHPLYILLMCIVVPFLQLITISKSGIIGFIMNFIGCVSFVLPVAIMMQKQRNKRNLLIGLILGILCLSITMQLWNYIFTPLFVPSMTRDKLLPFMLRFVLPFNLLKGFINLVLSLSLYMSIWPIMQKTNMLNKCFCNYENTRPTKLYVTILSIFILLTLILLLLVNSRLL